MSPSFSQQWAYPETLTVSPKSDTHAFDSIDIANPITMKGPALLVTANFTHNAPQAVVYANIPMFDGAGNWSYTRVHVLCIFENVSVATNIPVKYTAMGFAV